MSQGAATARPPVEPGVSRGKLVGWAFLVFALASLAYTANFSEAGNPDRDLLYKYATAVAGTIQYALMLVIVLAISRGIPRETLGLRRPHSWRRALGLMLGALLTVLVIAAALDHVLDAGEEQGLVPESWDSSRAGAFVVNFVVVAVLAPIVEELTFRGLGFASVSAAVGPAAAIVITALAFGLAHGLVVALPILSLFGGILAWLRWRTGSMYPSMLLHGLFNGLALIAAVSLGNSS